MFYSSNTVYNIVVGVLKYSLTLKIHRRNICITQPFIQELNYIYFVYL